MVKILSVVGARPNFVKIAPLLAAMRRRPDVHPVLVHTGQHYDHQMSDCFLQELGIHAPDFVLKTTAPDTAAPIERMTRDLTEVMRCERPDVVMVVGDVNSTLAGAVAAADLGIPVAHVEAGLRSFDPGMPEETNRIATDAVSSLLFASEPSAVRNLLAEGQPRERIFLVGNVMIDTLRQFLEAARRSDVLSRLGLTRNETPTKYALLTLHRPATVDDPAVFRRVWEAVRRIAADLPVIFPAHPRTSARLCEFGIEGVASSERADAARAIRMIGPLPYLDFVRLESAATLVLTDSGGVQEETTALRVPCLTLRTNTERPITVAEGTNQIVGLEAGAIVQAARRVLCGAVLPRRLPKLWDGRSAERIVSIVCRWCGRPPERLTGETLQPLPTHSVPAAVSC